MKPVRPLFTEYPGLEPAITCLELAALPTPVENLALTTSEGRQITNLWVKRDDQTSSIYGGNKVRKLEFVIADLKSKGVRKLVTFGGLGTNHGVATALFCQKAGIECSILLFDQPVTEGVRTNLKLMTRFGAKLERTGSLLKTALRFYARKTFSPADTYYLNAGGSNEFGAIAFVNAAFELKQQVVEGCLVEPDFIYCPVGSGGTVAGLSLGAQLAGLKSQVVGVRVAPSHLGPIPICTSKTAFSLKKDSYRHLKSSSPELPTLTLNPISLLDSYYGDGYGVPTAETTQTINCFSKGGIDLDHTYTAKAAAAALQCCLDHPDQTILYWHTYNSADSSKLVQDVSEQDFPDDVRAVLNRAN